MSDIFREVEEDVRREKLERIWKEYGDYIVAAVAIFILAMAGYRLWTVYESRQAAQASERYLAAQRLLESGQAQAAALEFARLAKTAPSGYARLSQMQEADALSATGNTAAALANYRALIASGDEMLSSIARIRAAWILVDGTPKSEVESTLGNLAADNSPWRQAAREILAYADYRAGDTKRALTEFQALARDPKSPSGVRGRTNAIATFITGGGDKNYGKAMYPEIPGTMLPGAPVLPQKPGAAPAAPSHAAAPLSNTPSAAPSNAAAPAGAQTTPSANTTTGTGKPTTAKGSSPK